jgi:hypothetical protein
MEVDVVVRRVPIIVTAPAEIEDPSATRFHFLKEAMGIRGVYEVIIKGTSSGLAKGEISTGGLLPFSNGGEMGIRMVPVLVTLMRLVYSVEVVVNIAAVEVVIIADDTTRAVVWRVVVTTALVIVETGNDPLCAGAVNTDRVSPGGIVVIPPIVVANGFGPERMLIGPDCARIADGLLTSVHWITRPLLPSESD